VPGLKEIWNEVFHQSCNLHDLCYASKGPRKVECDIWFYQNMLATCAMPGVGSAILPGPCLSSSTIMYNAVAVGARSSYDDGQKFAEENCR
jgi:hypothetical protein